MSESQEKDFSVLRAKMESAGFLFKKTGPPFNQGLRKKELIFTHPPLMEKLISDGKRPQGSNFYLKPLTEDENSRIGLVGGTTFPKIVESIFPKANGIDTYDNAPAWLNKEDDLSLDDLLESIKSYLKNSRNWSYEELKASVVVYIEMRNKEMSGEKYSKKPYYQKLSLQFNRTEKAFEYRMQNISYVYSCMGREWISGLKPAKNVGIKVARQIEEILKKVESLVPRLIIPWSIFIQLNISFKKIATMLC